MEALPRIDPPGSQWVTIEVHPYFLDHRFEGRAVFPAVETMQLLARAAAGSGSARARRIKDARFDKFLTIPENAAAIDVLIDLSVDSGGDVRARLKTRIRSLKTAMSRIRTHGSLIVSHGPAADPKPPADFESRVGEGRFDIDPETVYRDLVPFGPAYRNISGPLRLSPAGAVTRVAAPRLPAPENPLGSPFALDAAFHAACVWGQRYAGVVAFPVAIADRVVHMPTRAGREYICFVRPVSTDPGRLVFDIWLFDPDLGLCETVSGIAMQDVSGGRWNPPAWVVA
ncbi:MAG: polyketide synthase dehydratase domain-containing protein [Desulfobacterales bacterium]|nr:polyketide synthase dehydratase domain-containing protein [Desulfobacterales bacterium]